MRRFANYASFGVSAVASGIDVLKDVDALWVYNSPITVAWPLWATKLVHKVPSVVHVMDLWPDTILASGFSRRGAAFAAAERLLSPWCNAMYRSASSVAYISLGVGDALRKRGVPAEKLAYVPLWADETVFQPSTDDLRNDLGIPSESVVLLYAGTLGGAQGLSTLVDACGEIEDNRFVCLIAGSGVEEAPLRDRAERVGSTTIRFLGRLPQAKMTALMATADLVYIGLRPHALSQITTPSKTQAAMACGRPLLVAATGDVVDIVRTSDAGWAVDPGDPTAIANAIRRACAMGRLGLAEFGRKARTYYQEQFSVERGVRAIESLLADAANRQPTARITN